ncbi:MAG: hypothetical protein M1834_006518 [Cirrosporium novae-zelandiae]|nr:MAG: hypothetical protein M1834_006518 [Cirrosporium novae-zelandiae]
MSSFAPIDTLKDSNCQNIFTLYGIPSCFWAESYLVANGFFGCSDAYDNEGMVYGHDTWYRFLVKQVDINSTEKQGGIMQGPIYSWDEVGFFTRWTSPNRNVVLCFGIPPGEKKQLQTSLKTNWNEYGCFDPYFLHSIINYEILVLYDRSIWSMRDVIRKIEKAFQ